MILYERMKEQIRGGYYIQEEKYTNGVKIYSLQKDEKDGSSTFTYEFNKKLASKLIKETNVRLQPATATTCPLNFIPIPIKNNYARFSTNQITESKFFD